MGKFILKTQEYFLKRAMEVHGDAYDYSLSVYKGGHTKVVIICKEHGEFMQTPSNHFKGNGCPVCALRRIGRRGSESIKSGHYGITYVPSRKKWRVVIFDNNKRTFIGSFNSLELAVEAQEKEIRRIYGNGKVVDLVGEEWREIVIGEKYFISNKGRIKNANYLQRGIEMLMHPISNKGGYYHLSLNGKHYLVHRLVAKYFIGYSNKQVNHKDGNRQNNVVENLEYVNNRVNVCHGFIIINGRKYVGAHIRKRDGRYVSSIRIKDKTIWLGAFETPRGANDRYLRALLEYGLVEEYHRIVDMLSQND